MAGRGWALDGDNTWDLDMDDHAHVLHITSHYTVLLQCMLAWWL